MTRRRSLPKVFGTRPRRVVLAALATLALVPTAAWAAGGPSAVPDWMQRLMGHAPPAAERMMDAPGMQRMMRTPRGPADDARAGRPPRNGADDGRDAGPVRHAVPRERLDGRLAVRPVLFGRGRFDLNAYGLSKARAILGGRPLARELRLRPPTRLSPTR